MTYDGMGNMLTTRNPLFKTQTWTYDGLNNVTTYADASGDTTTFHYDDGARPTLLTSVD